MSAVVALPIEFKTDNVESYRDHKQSQEITPVADRLQVDTKLMQLWLRSTEQPKN